MPPREPGRHHEIGPSPLFPIRQLPRDYGGNFIRLHLSPLPQPGRLHRARRGNDDDEVHPPLAAGLEEQRNVEHDERAPRAPCTLHEAPLRFLDEGVQDRFEFFEARGVLGDERTERRPIDGARRDGARKRPADRTDRASASPLERVHGTIRVENRDARAAEHPGDRRFAHGDATRQPDHAHRTFPFGLTPGEEVE